MVSVALIECTKRGDIRSPNQRGSIYMNRGGWRGLTYQIKIFSEKSSDIETYKHILLNMYLILYSCQRFKNKVKFSRRKMERYPIEYFWAEMKCLVSSPHAHLRLG